MKYLNTANQECICNRFLKYVKIPTTSNCKNADAGIIPSTKEQFDFANILKDELIALGLENVQVTKNSYVYAKLNATNGFENINPFCLLAHLDTVEEVSGFNVNPQVIKNYDGKIIELKNKIVLNPELIPALKQAAQESDTIITTDGTTLLGGDDKAGIAIIVSALQYLIENPQVEHGPIEVIFSPDEETGHGMDKVPLELIKSKFAYTVDGGHLGELECECFNAFRSDITFTGVPSHTDSARANKMVNAITMASNFVQNIPRHESPETTDFRQGFYCPMRISGSMESATVSVYLRDFDIENMQKRKQLIEVLAESCAKSFGGNFQVEHIQQYLNMADEIKKVPFVKDILIQAYEQSGVEPNFKLIRGGTDGSRLSEMGIPTPNIFTGAHNYHSASEWVSLLQMTKATDIIIVLSNLIAKS